MGAQMTEAGSGGHRRAFPRNPGKTMPPRMRCPVCESLCFTRSSEEISPETRRLYYACSNIRCGLTYSAMLTVETVISPSGISPHFRPAVMRNARPPGHDYGQTSLFDHLPLRPPDDTGSG